MLVVCGEEWIDQVYGSTETHMSSLEQMEKICAAGVLAMDQLPLLEIDGLHLVQKLAIVRYLARKHSLYGQTPEEAVLIDILSDSLTDSVPNLRDPSKRNRALAKLERALRRNESVGGAEYLVGNHRSFADVQLWYVLDYLVDQAGSDSIAEFPLLSKFYAAFKSLPAITAYLASDKRFPRPGVDGYYDRVGASLPWIFGSNVEPPPLASHWHFKSE